jgi:hypothetical protein
VLGDDWFSLRYGHDVAGGYTPEMAARFDSFSFDYTAALDYLDAEMTNIDRDMAMARDLVGDMPIWAFLKAAAEESQLFPAATDVIAHSQRMIDNGAQVVCYYVYRACPGNYAEKQCLGNHPAAFRALSQWIQSRQ